MKRTPLLFLLCLTLLFFGLFHFEPSKAENESSNEVPVQKSFPAQIATSEISKSESQLSQYGTGQAMRLISEATGWESNIEPVGPVATNIFSSAGPGRVQGTDETFARLVIKAKNEGPVRVIVGLNTAFQPEGFLPNAQRVESQRKGIAQAQDSLIVQLMGSSARSITRFTFIPFIAMELDAAGLKFLQKSREVSSIEEDLPRPIALAESVPLIGGTAAWASGFSGAGQTIAILDTGVDRTHSFLSGKVVSEACYSTTDANFTSVCPGGVTESTSTGSGVNCPMFLNGDCAHGTHVAGIAAGKGTNFSGVAKDANIIAIQVFSQPVAGGRLGAFDSNLISGLQRVQQLSGSFNIAAVNMSLGGGLYTTNCDSTNSAMTAAIYNLRSIGIATVIASGNSGSTNGISFPACISSAISVGSTDDGSFGTTANAVSSFSNSALFLTLLAPGRWINSSVPGEGFLNMDGTSMAAPHVAGAWAVLKSKAPSATVDQVLQALTSTGLPVTDWRNGAGITKSRIKVDAAVSALWGPHVLTIASSNPNSGVSITVSPNDNSNLGSGTTQFTRTYSHNTNVTLTAPATAGGNDFQKWQRNGVDWSFSQATNVTLDVDYTMMAVYVTPPRTLMVSSTNPSSGVSILLSPNDNSGFGNGTTQFSRTYNNNTTVSLTAPATAGSNNFQKWQRNGVDWSVSQATNVTLDADYTMTAVYVPGLTSGLVGFWKFDENTGTTTADVSGSGNTGTLTSGAAWGAGQSGAAVSLDGVDDYVQVGAQSSLVMTTAASFTAWIHPTGPGSQPVTGGVIVNKEGEYVIARFSDSTIWWGFANTNPGWNWINTGSVAPLNQWTHVAVVYESGVVKTYINGVLTHTYNGSGAIGDVVATENDFRIGGRQDFSQNFQGRIDEVRVYNRAITASEITDLMGGPLSGFKGYWKFDENTGTTTADVSGSGNTGTLTSGAAWGAGQSGAAVSLDGVNDYVQVGAQSSLVMTSAASFTAWIHPTGPGSHPVNGGTIVNKEGEYVITRFPDGTIWWAFANTNPGWNWINTGSVAPLNQWTHVAVVYESGVVKTYINGVLTHTYNGSGAMGDAVATENDFRIGGRQDFSQNFQGRIDEVRVYNRAITASEINGWFH